VRIGAFVGGGLALWNPGPDSPLTLIPPFIGDNEDNVMRYRLDVLADHEGRLFLRGEPYTGIAYEVVGELVHANYQITNGTRGGPAEMWEEARTRVLLEALTTVGHDEIDEEFPEEGEYFDGAIFEGVAYGFDEDTGMLLQETDFCRDNPGPCREWFDSGVLSSYYSQRRPDGSSVCETYYPDGQIRTFEGDNVSWGQTEQRRLRTLRLTPGYPEPDLCPAPMEVDTTLLSLTGKGVTDDFLERLTNLETLEKLYLCRTGITGKGLEKFRVCAKLQELLTYPGNEFDEADVRQLLTSTPHCEWSNRSE
jgi:hypothetical protein